LNLLNYKAMFFGIDYGAKKAGTTAICFEKDGFLHISSSIKDKDADAFIQNYIEKLKPSQIFIDAPLSLPLAYYNKGNDFHFRECDRLTKAMSPMFLGGLTARAITLKQQNPTIEFYESYPKMLCEELQLKLNYKKDIQNFLAQLKLIFPHKLLHNPKNWHEVDAILAWIIGFRYQKQKAIAIGNTEEGLIFY